MVTHCFEPDLCIISFAAFCCKIIVLSSKNSIKQYNNSIKQYKKSITTHLDLVLPRPLLSQQLRLPSPCALRRVLACAKIDPNSIQNGPHKSWISY